MANATWPASLPQSPRVIGYGETFKSTAIQTAMDAGPPKTRQRFTAAPVPWETEYLLNATQVETLRAFFEETLAGGTLPFDSIHPRTRTFCTMVFRDPGNSPPSLQAAGGGLFTVRTQFFILP